VNAPVIQLPTTLAADSVQLADDTEVVGVEAGGRKRAYVLEALFEPRNHCVNDVLGGKPITVTYCIRNDLVAVFTDPNGDQPLEIATAGYKGYLLPSVTAGGRQKSMVGSLILRVGSSLFRQENGRAIGKQAERQLPYPKAEFIRTRWVNWRHAHSDTDVFVGETSDGAPSLDFKETNP